MSKDEELQHLETHAIHLRKVLEITNQRIEELNKILCYVENKPVYVGSNLWFKHGGHWYKVEGIETHADGNMAFVSTSENERDGDWIDYYTWEPPKQIDPFSEQKAAFCCG